MPLCALVAGYLSDSRPSVQPPPKLSARRCGALLPLPPRLTLPASARQSQRIAFPQLLQLQAVDPLTLVPQDESLVVVGRFLSEQGLGFFHQEPMPHRFVVVSIDVPGDAPTRLLLDVSWCRFTRHGWYESGGRFLRVAE